MDYDDDFGELYTDNIRKESAPPASQGGVDLNFDIDDEKTSHLNSGTTAPRWNLNSSDQDKILPASGSFDLNLDANAEEAAKINAFVGKGGGSLHSKDSGESSLMKDDDVNKIVEEREERNEDKNCTVEEENTYTKNFVNAADVMSPEQIIPWLSEEMLENPRLPFLDAEWENEESDDDLQIVLNDNNEKMGMEMMPGTIDDEDGDGEPAAVADAGHHHQADEQGPGGEEEDGRADVEKDLGESSKATGGEGGSAPAPAQATLSSSQFKYVRPGAETLPGTAPVGITGHILPPITAGPPAGCGRGDWRPSGMNRTMPMQKEYDPGYGIHARGVNTAGRGAWGFTLPSYKTIFDVDIDSFEEKRWKLPGLEASDFFNFHLNEDSWRDYRNQLNYYRDLPPELQAVVGTQDNPSGDSNHGKIDSVPDLARQGSRPVGLPIPVDISSGDRLPSIEMRSPRMHDTDTIIEIVCHSPVNSDDSSPDRDTGLPLEKSRSTKEKRHIRSYRGGDAKSSLHRHEKSESADRRKKRDISEGTWNWRNDDLRGRTRLEDHRRREHGLEVSYRNRDKPRKGQKIEKDALYQSRNQLDSGSWRRTNDDYNIVGSRHRDGGNRLKSRSERVDDLCSNRRYEELHAENDETSHSHTKSSAQKKRRDDGSDQLKRDHKGKSKDGEVQYAHKKEGGSSRRDKSEKLRERDERHRVKQDDHLLRGNDGSKASNREYYSKDIGRHGDLLKQRDRVESDFSQPRSHEDVYIRRNQLSNVEKISRDNEPTSRNECVSYGPDTSRMCENKKKGTTTISSRETASGDHSSLIPPKWNRDDDGGSVSETANLSGRTEKKSGHGHTDHQPSGKQKDDSSTDDEQPDPMRGRSKLERWSSHKETDHAITPTTPPSPNKRDQDANNSSTGSLATRDPEEESTAVNKTESKPPEEESTAVNKTEREPLPLIQTETCIDSEIKSERPARRSRWSDN